VPNNPDRQKRQTTYIEALDTIGVKMYYDKYQSAILECHRCGNVWAGYNEKMTGVILATQMLVGACQDQYDMAMLIS